MLGQEKEKQLLLQEKIIPTKVVMAKTDKVENKDQKVEKSTKKSVKALIQKRKLRKIF